MELGKAFTYVFEDKRWFGKLIIGWLVSLVPILNFAFAGFITETIRNVEEDQPTPLPEWEDFGKKFVLGFYLWIAGIIYSLPIIILSILFLVPVMIASGNSNNNNTVSGILAGTGFFVICLMVIYALLLSFLMPALNINLARKQTFGAMFEIGEFFHLVGRNTGNYIVAWLMTIVWAIAIGFVGGLVATVLAIIPCIGWIAAFIVGGLITVLIPVVYAHLFGQVAKKDRETVAPVAV